MKHPFQLARLCFPALTIAASLTALPAVYSMGKPDPQMQVVLDKLTSQNPKPIESLSPEEARKQPNAATATLAVMKDKGIKVPDYAGEIDNTTFKLGDSKIDVRIYTPKGTGPFPAILYIHGGGWVIADLDTYEASSRELAINTGAVVVSADYRKGPENKFPAAHNDTVGAYEYILGNAAKLKIDPKHIAVVGESAGGNMALAVCLAAKEKNLAMPVYQVLVYPVADVASPTSPSIEENKDAKPLNSAMMQWFGKHYLNGPADASDPRMSPALAGEKLKGLPPATIIAAEIDPLLSGVEALNKALQAAGVKVNYQYYSGVTHEFFGMGTVLDKAKQAEDVVNADLKAAFAK